MSTPGTSPAEVGRQLARRREDLDLTQEDLAQRIGVVAKTVSGVERGLSSISRSKRPAWEKALALRAGTISRAYRDGAPIEIAPAKQEISGDTFPRTDVGRELLELAGTDRFLDRVREVIPQLPAEDRSLVEEVLAAYLASEVGHREDQERKRRMVDRIIRRRRARGNADAEGDGGHAAAG